MNHRNLQLVLSLCLVMGISCNAANAQGDPAFGYKSQRNVVYGEGIVAPEGEPVSRELRLDVYLPEVSDGPTPAVVYVHGGAYHRGGRMQPPFQLDGVVHSRPEDYARLLAPLGYAVFVVEYRLALELPEPELTPGDANTVEDISEVVTPFSLTATSHARTSMGLRALDDSYEDMLFIWKASIAAAEDVVKAIDFVIENADEYNVDPSRIAVGGHSAGGGITVNVGLAMHDSVKAIFPMSPPDTLFSKSAIVERDGLPATLLVYSQFDYPYLLSTAPGLIAMLEDADAEHEFAWVPGMPHFYPHGAPSLGADGTRRSVGDRIVEFLGKHLKK